MSRAIVCLVALGCASMALAQPPPPRDSPLATGTAIVRGRVIAAGTDRALARVEVRAISGPLRVNKAVLTGTDGRFEIGDLPAGKFTIAANKANYVRESWGQKRALGPGTPIELANGQVVQQIDFALQRTGAIAGRITDEFGDPAPDVQVMPMRYAFINGERRLQPFGMPSTTNDLGEYRLFGLVPGQYIVSATMRNMTFGTETTDNTAYAPTYYPGTGSSGEAQRVTVNAAQTVSGMNMTLLPVTAVRVSGVATDLQGKPLVNAFVNLMPRSGFIMGTVNGGQVRADGTWTISGVTAGEYIARANMPGMQSDEYATAEVTVGGGDVTEVQLVSAKLSVVRGRVVFEPGTAKPPSPTAVRVMTVSAIPMMMGPVGNTTAKEDGTFELKMGAVHVQFRATVFGTGDWRLKRVVIGGVDVIDSGLDILPNATLDNVVVEMTSQHSEITGTVTSADGAKIRDCVVVLFARDQQRWVSQSRYFGVSRPDADSLFHARLPAGEYYAAAFEDTETNLGIFSDPEILNQLRDRATPFSIGEADKISLDLKLGQPPVY
jgi:carboxypeptidase family protein